eukprot:scaffold2374_cov226-Prasinococcus_capsulatus_cf.AAC.3
MVRRPLRSACLSCSCARSRGGCSCSCTLLLRACHDAALCCASGRRVRASSRCPRGAAVSERPSAWALWRAGWRGMVKRRWAAASACA